MEITEFKEIRSIGRKSSKSEWYLQYCKAWDTGGVKAAKRVIKNNPKIFKAIAEISTSYKPNTMGSSFNRHELYALRHPKRFNVCPCGNVLSFVSSKGDWMTGCSPSCAAFQSIESKKSTCLEKYGVENPSQAEKVKAKRAKTNLRKYGVENVYQAEAIKSKIKDTLLSKYGVENPSQAKEVKDKKLETTLNNYGVENPSQSNVVQARKSKTMRKNHGVSHSYLLPRFKRKRYTDRFGKLHIVQGYEPKALSFLDRQQKVTKLETSTSKVPKFKYSYEGKTRTYYPDILAQTKSKSHVIEVKSDFTLKLDLGRNIKKFSAATKQCKENGLTFWLFYYASRTKLIKVKNPAKISDLKRAGIL